MSSGQVRPGDNFRRGIDSDFVNRTRDLLDRANRVSGYGPAWEPGSELPPGCVWLINADAPPPAGVNGEAIELYEPVFPGERLFGLAVCRGAFAADRVAAIAQAPIPPGGVGVAMLSGITLATVDVTDVGHQFAAVDAEAPGRLISAETGDMRIVNPPAATGPQLLLLRLGSAAPGSAPADIYTGPFAVSLVNRTITVAGGTIRYGLSSVVNFPGWTVGAPLADPIYVCAYLAPNTSGGSVPTTGLSATADMPGNLSSREYILLAVISGGVVDQVARWHIYVPWRV